MTNLQQALKRYFETNNNSFKDLAHDLGMPESWVLRWLAGASQPHPSFEVVVLSAIDRLS